MTVASASRRLPLFLLVDRAAELGDAAVIVEIAHRRQQLGLKYHLSRSELGLHLLDQFGLQRRRDDDVQTSSHSVVLQAVGAGSRPERARQ